MTPLSVIIITLNEERNIGRCIESLLPVADEIIVVDSFSTDKTKEICLSHGVRYMENPWKGYSAQKNFAQKMASHDFILSLDADEALSKELSASILRIKNESIGLYSFNRLTNYCGKWIRHGGWYPDIKIRLYDRRECEWEGNIHERLKIAAGQKPVLLEGECFHYTFYSVSEHLAQVNKFTTLMADEAYEKGERSSWFYILFSPVVKFVRDFIFRLGFMDGYEGFLVSRISAYATFLKYVKLRMRERNNGSR